jgi:hypothetical protein
MPADWLVQLEGSLAADQEGENVATALVVLAAVAGREVPLDEDEVRGASRRALLLLAAGGDPERGLDLNGRAVESMADDLDEAGGLEALGRGLEEVQAEAIGLPHVSELLHALAGDEKIAWRAFACSLLAAELADAE